MAFENNLPKATITNLIKGLARPSIVTLKRIADGLGVELLDLFTHPNESERHRVVDLTRNASAAAIRSATAVLARSQPGPARARGTATPAVK